MNQTQQNYLNSYLNSLNAQQREDIKVITVEHFCDNQKDADELAQLVLLGRKTATCSMKFWYDKSDEEIQPQVGNLMLVTDFTGNPICIIQTTSVEVKRFCDVDATFAYLEGEGDRSLGYWQKAHWQYFCQECKHKGIEPDKEMLLYLEKFKVVYP